MSDIYKLKADFVSQLNELNLAFNFLQLRTGVNVTNLSYECCRVTDNGRPVWERINVLLDNGTYLPVCVTMDSYPAMFRDLQKALAYYEELKSYD